MGFLEDSVILAREFIDATGKKSGELVEAQKLKLAIAKFRSQLSEDYQTLGRLAYDAAKNGTDIDEVHAAIVLAIDEKLEKLPACRKSWPESRGCASAISVDAAILPPRSIVAVAVKS